MTRLVFHVVNRSQIQYLCWSVERLLFTSVGAGTGPVFRLIPQGVPITLRQVYCCSFQLYSELFPMCIIIVGLFSAFWPWHPYLSPNSIASPSHNDPHFTHFCSPKHPALFLFPPSFLCRNMQTFQREDWQDLLSSPISSITLPSNALSSSFPRTDTKSPCLLIPTPAPPISSYTRLASDSSCMFHLHFSNRVGNKDTIMRTEMLHHLAEPWKCNIRV